MEALVVVALIGIILAITIAAFSRYLQESRLHVVTRQLGSAISLTRLKAVSTNMKYTFRVQADVDPNVYSSTGTNDLNNSGDIQPWEDVNGDGLVAVDSVYKTPQKISNNDHPVIDHAGISILPNSANVSLAMDTGSIVSIIFNGQGQVLSMQDNSSVAKNYIVIQSQGYTDAVYVDSTGFVRLYRYVSPGWVELQ